MEEDRLYDVYAIEEDIKILEEIINRPIKDTKGTKIVKQALKHLIEAYRKTKQELESVKEIYYTQKEIEENYIPKSKIKEKIEELKKCLTDTNVIMISILEKLLEEE